MDTLKEKEWEAASNCNRMFNNTVHGDRIKATFEVGTDEQCMKVLEDDTTLPLGNERERQARIFVILAAHHAEAAREEAESKERLRLANEQLRNQAIEALIKAEKIREELGLPKLHYETQKYTRDDEYGRPVPEVTIGNRYGKNPDEYAKTKEEIEVMEEQKKTAEHVKTSDEIRAASNDPQPLKGEKAKKEANRQA